MSGNHSPLNWVFLSTHQAATTSVTKPGKLQNRRYKAWNFIPHSTAYLTIYLLITGFVNCNLWHGMDFFFCWFFLYKVSDFQTVIRCFGCEVGDGVRMQTHFRLCRQFFFFVCLFECVCVTSGRPVSLTSVFTDCGRLAGCVFILLKLLVHWNEMLVLFSWTNVWSTGRSSSVHPTVGYVASWHFSRLLHTLLFSAPSE